MREAHEPNEGPARKERGTMGGTANAWLPTTLSMRPQVGAASRLASGCAACCVLSCPTAVPCCGVPCDVGTLVRPLLRPDAPAPARLCTCRLSHGATIPRVASRTNVPTLPPEGWVPGKGLALYVMAPVLAFQYPEISSTS